MFENSSEAERKKIFWILLIGTGLIIFIIWLILVVKGYVLKSSTIEEAKKQNSAQQNTTSFTNEFKNALSGFNKLDVKGKISDMTNSLKSISNNENSAENNNLNQNENQTLNLNENVNQEQEQVQVNEQEPTEEPLNQDIQENISIPSNPRLPIE